jgi:hypothetical protein
MSAPKKAKLMSSSSKELLSVKPVLKSMEKEGTLFDCWEAAFKGHEDELVERLNAALPDQWMEAPDQTVMLQYNWVIDKEGKHVKDGLKLDFKDDKIRLGQYVGRVDVKREEINNGSFIIDKGGCAECMGDECYKFELFLNPKKGAYKLQFDEYITCYCGGGEETLCEESSCVAYPS